MKLLILSTLVLLLTIACSSAQAQSNPKAPQNVRVESTVTGAVANLKVFWNPPSEGVHISVEVRDESGNGPIVYDAEFPEDGLIRVWWHDGPVDGWQKANCSVGNNLLIFSSACFRDWNPPAGVEKTARFAVQQGSTYDVRVAFIQDFQYHWSEVHTVTIGASNPPTPPPPTATPSPTTVPTPGPTRVIISTPTPTPRPPQATPQAPVAGESLGDMIARIRPAIVKIHNSIGGQGSGAIFRTDGNNAYVITNQHVVGYDVEVTVTVNDSRAISGPVLGVDVRRDLAVVRIPCTSCSSVEFGDSETLRQGDPVIAVGYPLDRYQPKRIINPSTITVTTGIVSAFRYESERDRQLVQTDAAISGGNSGGPLLTNDGKIVGINTWHFPDHEGLNYAVLETTVQKHLPALTSGNLPRPTPEPPPEDRWVYVFAPEAGHLHHDPDNGLMEWLNAHIWRKDLMVRAWFGNPYNASISPAFGGRQFSYGFVMRSGNDGPPLYFVMHSGDLSNSPGRWYLLKGNTAPRQVIASGQADDLRKRSEQWNHLAAATFGNEAWFFLNGELLQDSATGNTRFDLGTDTQAGTVRIMTGPISHTERLGAFTDFEAFYGATVVTSTVSDGHAVQEALDEFANNWQDRDPQNDKGTEGAHEHLEPVQEAPPATAEPTPTP